MRPCRSGVVGMPDPSGWAGEIGSLPTGGVCCVGESVLPSMELQDVSSLCGSGDTEKATDWISYEILQDQKLYPSQVY